MKYTSSRSFSHSEQAQVGILLANLGTPCLPNTSSLKRYLAEFLSDPRVIEIPKWKWWPILHGTVLRTRPAESAALYEQVWTEAGSPLLVTAIEQKEALEKIFKQEVGNPVKIEIGMRYGQPSIASAMRKMREDGVRKLFVLPLYPQYSAASTASVYDAVFAELKRWRVLPELRARMAYHDDPLFIDSLVDSIKSAWEGRERPEKLVFSYHGIPLRYVTSGDPYHCHCHKTTRLVVEKLKLAASDYEVSFQSIFGREEWLKPGTDQMMEALAKNGVKNIDVICPGFSADCLETLEEVEQENREIFISHGGETFNYIPALNAGEKVMRALAELCKREMSGWIVEKEEWDAKADSELSKNCDRRYQELKQQGYQEVKRAQGVDWLLPRTKKAGSGNN